MNIYLNTCRPVFVLFLIFLADQLSPVTGRNNWGYKPGSMDYVDTSRWKDLPGYSCGGSNQSPVDINTEDLVYSHSLLPMEISKNSNFASKVQLKKCSSGLELEFNDIWEISFGDDSCLRPVGIHWGSNDTKGSEHTIDGMTLPLEGHLVSYNCKFYKSFREAVSAMNGLYVIGLLYQVGQDSMPFDAILKSLESLKKHQSILVDEIDPSEFLPPVLSEYYRYQGSLTTPPCTENVIWTVMADILPIGRSQWDLLRTFKFDPPQSGPMVDTFRPVQPINCRKVYAPINDDFMDE